MRTFVECQLMLYQYFMLYDTTVKVEAINELHDGQGLKERVLQRLNLIGL